MFTVVLNSTPDTILHYTLNSPVTAICLVLLLLLLYYCWFWCLCQLKNQLILVETVRKAQPVSLSFVSCAGLRLWCVCVCVFRGGAVLVTGCCLVVSPPPPPPLLLQVSLSRRPAARRLF